MISSDEANFLVYRYLLENGFSHSAFTFAHESLVARSVVADAEVPPGALVTFLQKGLQYVEVESHLHEDGTERPCDEPFHLLAPHICRVKYVPRRGGDGAEGVGAGAVVPEVPTADVTILKGHTSEVFTCQFHPTRPDVLATGSGDGTGRVWSLSDRSGPSGEPACVVLRHSQSGPKGKSVTRDVASLDWSRDGSRLATGCYDGRARIWNTSSGDGGGLAAVLTGHTQPILSVQWSPGGAQLLTGSVDKTVCVWDAATGALAQQFAFHAAPVLDVDWASDELFAACSSDKTITLCSTEERAPLRTLRGHKDEVNAIHWSPSRAVLASASDDLTAKLWAAAADKDAGAAATLAGHKKAVYTVKWAPTGEGSANAGKDASLATASLDSTVKLWDPSTAKERVTLARHSAMVYAMSFSPDGEFLVSGSTDRSVYVWRVRDGGLVRSFSAPSGVYDLAFNATGDKIAVCCANAAVAVVDLRF